MEPDDRGIEDADERDGVINDDIIIESDYYDEIEGEDPMIREID